MARCQHLYACDPWNSGTPYCCFLCFLLLTSSRAHPCFHHARSAWSGLLDVPDDHPQMSAVGRTTRRLLTTQLNAQWRGFVRSDFLLTLVCRSSLDASRSLGRNVFRTASVCAQPPLAVGPCAASASEKPRTKALLSLDSFSIPHNFSGGSGCLCCFRVAFAQQDIPDTS